jgi:hypothetical protein
MRSLVRLSSSQRNENMIISLHFVFVVLFEHEKVTSPLFRTKRNQTGSQYEIGGLAAMDSDTNEDILTYRRQASLRQRHGDWEAAARIRRCGLAMLYESRPQFSLPRVRFDIEEITEDMCLFYYRFTHRQLRRLQALFGPTDVVHAGSHSFVRAAVV